MQPNTGHSGTSQNEITKPELDNELLHVRLLFGSSKGSSGGNLKDLSRREECFQKSYDRRRDSPLALYDLAAVLLERFAYDEDPVLLGTAIKHYREALLLLPQNHPVRKMAMGELAAALQALYQRGGDSSNVEEAEILARNPDEQTADNDLPNYSTRSTDLRDLISLVGANAGVSATLPSAVPVTLDLDSSVGGITDAPSAPPASEPGSSHSETFPRSSQTFDIAASLQYAFFGATTALNHSPVDSDPRVFALQTNAYYNLEVYLRVGLALPSSTERFERTFPMGQVSALIEHDRLIYKVRNYSPIKRALNDEME